MQKIKICTVVTGGSLSVFLDNLMVIQDKIDFIELRVDHIHNLTVDDINIIAKHTHKKAIFTCRHKNEGGNYLHDRSIQLEIINRAVNLEFDYIDIDLEILKSKKINKSSSQLIVSHHNFVDTPSYRELEKILNQMRRTKANVYKIATLVNCQNDNLVLMKLLFNKSADEKLIVLGMGKKGQITRVLSPMLGAYLTFASSQNTSSAPGQISLSKLKKIYKSNSA